MKLAETQRLFWELLQGTEGPLDAFVGSSALPAEERVAIYARMFLHRQVDALREMFPKVVAALGDEGFFEVAARYVHDHPSEHPDLGQLGRTFAAFLERPDLRDLARLEWARGEVFEAAEAAPLSPEEFARLARRRMPSWIAAYSSFLRCACSSWSTTSDSSGTKARKRQALGRSASSSGGPGSTFSTCKSTQTKRARSKSPPMAQPWGRSAACSATRHVPPTCSRAGSPKAGSERARLDRPPGVEVPRGGGAMHALETGVPTATIGIGGTHV